MTLTSGLIITCVFGLLFCVVVVAAMVRSTRV